MSFITNNTYIYSTDTPSQIGTVGGFFKIDSGSDIYGITNFHVVQRNGACSVGDPIHEYQSRSKIGTLQYWFGLDQGDALNYFDLALFKIDTSVITPAWNISIDGFADSAGISTVQMIKGNNQVRIGVCKGIQPGPFGINIAGKLYNFTNLLEIRSASYNYDFSYPGESGSIILFGNRIVALLIGADPNDPTLSFAIPFLDSLQNKGIRNYIDLSWAI